MSLIFARKILEKVEGCPTVWINGTEFNKPYSENEFMEHISGGISELAVEEKDYSCPQVLYPGQSSVTDLVKTFNAHVKIEYRRKILDLLTGIRQDLSRMSDKQELKAFVDGLNPKSLE